MPRIMPGFPGKICADPSYRGTEIAVPNRRAGLVVALR
jgi:hypothetical protein